MVIIVVAAVLNGTLREKVIVPVIGTSMALTLSGVLLAILVFMLSLIFMPFIGAKEAEVYIGIGFFWVGLTLSFELIFGHFVVGKSGQEIRQVFNLKKGDLFIVVLCVTAISPWLAAKVRFFFAPGDA
ncbi:MAG: putative tellurium resistance membrane protein TerC [Paraglaciecola sp.]|jgi:predicted tellurium resistance membrane protein TerC